MIGRLPLDEQLAYLKDLLSRNDVLVEVLNRTTALDLTDRDAVTGAVRFAQAALEHGIRPIFGINLAVRPVRIGREALRCLLARRGISFQRTKTGKESPAPDFDGKLARIEYAMNERPDRTFAFDEFGPLGIRPTAGSCWAEQGRPDRLPATYRRTHGITCFHGCYSVGDDQMWEINRRRKGIDHARAALRTIRAARPDGAPIHVILDNLSAHLNWRIRRWAPGTRSNCASLRPTRPEPTRSRPTSDPCGSSPSPTPTTPAIRSRPGPCTHNLRWRNQNARPPRRPRRPTTRTRPHPQRERHPLGRPPRCRVTRCPAGGQADEAISFGP